MAKVKLNLLEPILKDYWIGKQIYYNDDPNPRTITNINILAKNWIVIIEDDQGDKYQGFIDDLFNFEIPEKRVKIIANKKYLDPK